MVVSGTYMLSHCLAQLSNEFILRKVFGDSLTQGIK